MGYARTLRQHLQQSLDDQPIGDRESEIGQCIRNIGFSKFETPPMKITPMAGCGTPGASSSRIISGCRRCASSLRMGAVTVCWRGAKDVCPWVPEATPMVFSMVSAGTAC